MSELYLMGAQHASTNSGLCISCNNNNEQPVVKEKTHMQTSDPQAECWEVRWAWLLPLIQPCSSMWTKRHSDAPKNGRRPDITFLTSEGGGGYCTTHINQRFISWEIQSTNPPSHTRFICRRTIGKNQKIQHLHTFHQTPSGKRDMKLLNPR